jgi:hypothetical protein
MKDAIQTFSGVMFRPLSPDPKLVRLADIARALSHVNRFTGHTILPYSVAEHSVRVGRLAGQLAERAGKTKTEVIKITRAGLMHDATEAYLADVAAPIKHTPAFAGYRAAEERLWLAIAEACGLEPELPEEVKRADLIMLATEAAELLPGGPNEGEWSLPYPALSPQGLGWDPGFAERTFLDTFRELGSAT